MGNIGSYISQSFPPKSKFSVGDIPDLTGSVIVVTGGNAGIGYEIIKALLPKNAKVYMLSRSKERAESAISRLKTETGKEALFIQLDLSDLDSVRRASDELISKESKLDVLFNNGGVMNTPIEQLTAQGFDLQFGTNVIGHFLLTKRLMPLLLSGAQSSTDKKARVVNQSSSAQMFVDTIDLGALKDVPARTKLGSAKLYMQSKFANIVFSNELARRYGDKGIVSTSLNPGNLKTDLQRHTPAAFMMLFGWMFSPAPYGALTPLYGGVSTASVDLNGKYLIPWARVGYMRKEAEDPELGEKLWNWLETETNKS
ncbi:NAD(P)-binding protein [Mycena belliarum]|uniref:NAD(P)-binding protein n=1 Tax=Mycena belliarum TaxID=1033014 RepID=A0AAD6UI69_9AGAR|nr:NAD(P)-binding protein [Mycena belliae]